MFASMPPHFFRLLLYPGYVCPFPVLFSFVYIFAFFHTIYAMSSVKIHLNHAGSGAGKSVKAKHGKSGHSHSPADVEATLGTQMTKYPSAQCRSAVLVPAHIGATHAHIEGQA